MKTTVDPNLGPLPPYTKIGMARMRSYAIFSFWEICSLTPVTDAVVRSQ